MRATTEVWRDDAGMSVAEVLMALGILMVGLMALVAAMPLSTSHIAESQLTTTATFLAQQRLERIKNARWTIAADSLFGANSPGTAPVAQWPDEAYGTIVIPETEACPPTSPSVSCYPGFRREVRIADCSVVSCSGIAIGVAGTNTLRRVTVTVFFRPLAGTGMLTPLTEASVQLATLISRRP
jgi:hypothetical protein